MHYKIPFLNPLWIKKNKLLFIIIISLLASPCIGNNYLYAKAPANQTSLTTSIHTSQKHSTVTQLPNGLTVLILEDKRFPIVSTRLYVRTGSAYETPKQAGISHILEHMVFKGTKTRPNSKISQEVEAAGGYLNAATSYDYTVYITDMPSRHWKLGMDVVKDMAFHPTLDPKDLESEKKVILAELARGEDNPHSLAFKKVLEQSLDGTPYARPIIGYPDTINQTTSQNLKDYIAEHYQPQDMLLVVIGDINPQEVLKEATKLFGSYKNTKNIQKTIPIEAKNLPIPTNQGTVMVIPGAWNKVYIAMAIPVPDIMNVQSNTLDVLAQLLGGDKTSLFYRTYHYEKQLVEDISVYNYNFERLGVLLTIAEVDVDKLQPFWETFTKDLSKLHTIKFTQQEMNRAKLNLEDDLYRTKETLPGLASKIGYFALFLNGEEGEKNTIESIRNVDMTMINNAISQWIQPERISTVVLSPKDIPISNLQTTLEKNWPKTTHKKIIETVEKEAIETIQLGNGQTIILIPDETLPYYYTTLMFSGGEALITKEQQGLPFLVANLLSKGTQAKTATEIQDFLADRASILSTSIDRKTFSISITGPSRFSTDVLNLLLDTIKDSTFPVTEVSREIQNQLAAIKSSEDRPIELAFRKIPPFLFPNSIYGYLRLGEPEQIKLFTQNDIKKFWEKQKTHPWVLSVVGKFNREQILQFAKQLPKPTEGKVYVPEPVWSNNHELTINMPERHQGHLMLIYKTVPDTNPEEPAFEVIENVLNGSGGILFRELRDEQALGYAVTAMNRQNTDFGYMFFYIGTDPKKLSIAEKSFEESIKKSLINKVLPENEISRAKNQIEGDFYRERQSLQSRAHEAAKLTMEEKPLSYKIDQIKKSMSVTPKEIQHLAQKYFSKKQPYIIKILP